MHESETYSTRVVGTKQETAHTVAVGDGTQRDLSVDQLGLELHVTYPTLLYRVGKTRDLWQTSAESETSSIHVVGTSSHWEIGHRSGWRDAEVSDPDSSRWDRM